jgi:cob(I)alamin adenosyltransferase
MLQIYCGDGKGKTTASLGLAVRMAGAGMKAAFVQFMKGGETAELETLKLIPNIDVMRCDREYGWFSALSDSDKAELTACHNELMKKVFSGSFDAVILDEFNFAYKTGLVDREMAADLIMNAKDSREVVLTGRDPDPQFVESADLISEIKCVRHPYQKGIKARKGIEY